ncbi:BON domain-containing protein [Rhizobium halophytocola]|uniref:Flp pilus assembly secretin CpaC n=1 Tax=Rhizobium halophytocola TaxID=735519 RepID=A0ABS4DX38_9HYPH|nr:BON domain-containing protein [Rhizobium halophytocola]MBP1850259.1 Flp pilus assembly secretin CpaC [Rhizobium halophytocola]
MVFKPATFHGEPPEVEIENPPQPSLEIVAADLLATTDGVDATGISVTQRDGGIVLSGTVAEPSEVERALQIVRSIPGVESVTLELEVINAAERHLG